MDSDHPGQPSSEIARLRLDLIEVQSNLAVAEARIEAHEQLLKALAVAVPKEKRAAMLTMVGALAQLAAAEGEEAAAQLVQLQTNTWRALFGESGDANSMDATLAIAGAATLLRSAPEGQREAMQTWISIASDEEVAQDIQDIFPGWPHGGPPPASAANPPQPGGEQKDSDEGDGSSK